jgi:hypothetical protein
MRIGALVLFVFALLLAGCGAASQAPEVTSCPEPPASTRARVPGGASGPHTLSDEGRSLVSFAIENSLGWSLRGAKIEIDGRTVADWRDDTHPPRPAASFFWPVSRQEPERPLSFDAHLSKGEHEAKITLLLVGWYMWCGYCRAMRPLVIEIRHTERFAVIEPEQRIKVISYERGGVTTPLEERPAVRFE